jgi:hypothetical protein
MNITLSRTIVLVVVLLAVGVAIGRYSLPARVETREVVKEVERKERQRHTETVIREQPDGSKETRIVEDTHSTSDSEATAERQRLELSAPNWRLTAGYATDRAYSLGVERRLIGPLFIGVSGRSGPRGTDAGLFLGLEF